MRYLITWAPVSQGGALQAVYGPDGRVATAPSASQDHLAHGDATVKERADHLEWEPYCAWQAKQLPYTLRWETIDWDGTPLALLDHLVQFADPPPLTEQPDEPDRRSGPVQGLPWDHPDLQVSGDTGWRAGCRLLQTWWRQEHLGLAEYGPRDRPKTPDAPQRLVGSMLPLNPNPPASNFLTPEVVAEVEYRRARKGWGGMVQPDRLQRNLLSSQPLCFNLFGYLKHHPDALLTWVRTVVPHADEVTEVRIEWAPPRELHFGGGSAFDALIIYRADDKLGFLGIETKYAELLGEKPIIVAPDSAYVVATDRWGHWKPDSFQHLRKRRPVQFWLNTLLAQSCVLHAEEGFAEGSVVVMACDADADALEATTEVRDRLHDPNRWLRWCSYEALLDTIAGDHEVKDWATSFRTRYLDTRPISALLDPDDLRVAPRIDPSDGIARLMPEGAWIMPSGLDGRLLYAHPDLITVRAITATTTALAFDYGSGKGWDATFRLTDLTSDNADWGFVRSLDSDLCLTTSQVPGR